jgi:molecular chaperone GrpE (heat shock protein)
MSLDPPFGGGDSKADENTEESGGPEGARRSDEGSVRLEDVEARLLAGMEQLRTDFERKFAVTETKDRQIEAMRSEIEILRGDVVAKTLRPLIVSMINAHDNLSKVIAHYLAKGGESPAVPVAELVARLKDVQEDLSLTLSENGVDLFSEDNAGGAFNGQRQRVIGYVQPDHAGQVGAVAECARAGFETDVGLIEKERVRIYRGEPAKSAAGEIKTSES